jgi:uncharacterized membrane protein YuzA (DUF378 family)
MTTLIYILTGLATALGIGVVVWSFLDTRKKYYDEYKNRKEK